MTQTDFEKIEPLIASSRIQGNEIHCTFRCPITDFEISSSSTISRGSNYTDRLIDHTVEDLSYRIRSTVWSKARQMLGDSDLGRMASDFVFRAVQDLGSNDIVTNTEKEDAIVKAFERVKSHFRLTQEGWVSKIVDQEYTHEFAKHLREHPVVLRYDRFILSRVLAHIAEVDGTVSPKEQQLFETFATPDFDEWGRPPSATELQELSDGVKQTVLMLSWALALSDTQLAHQELTTILESAGNLGLSSEDLQKTKQWAQEYLVDRALESAYQGPIVYTEGLEQAREISDSLGVEPGTFERLEIRCQKRHGNY